MKSSSYYGNIKNLVPALISGKISLHNLPRLFIKFLEYKILIQQKQPNINTIYGTKLFLNKNDKIISQALILNKFWEREESEFFKKIIIDGMHVIDIGANIGYFSTLFSKWVGKMGRVFSFEPEPENFKLLQKNIQANEDVNITPYNIAISNHNGKINLFQSEENKGDHRIINFNVFEKDGERKKIFVDCKKLDSVIPLNLTIDLIKMDIQGAEMLALDGMNEIISKNPNICIMTEFWPYAIEKSGFLPKEFIEKLHQHGFKIHLLQNQQLISLTSNFKLLSDYSPIDQVNLFCQKIHE